VIKFIKPLVISSLLSILTACGNQADNSESNTSSTTTAPQIAPITQAVDSFRPPVSTEAQTSPLKARDLVKSPIPTLVTLTAATAKETALVLKNNETSTEDQMGKPLQIGFGRNVAQTETSTKTQQVLNWVATPSGGLIAAINFNSIGAKGMQIGLLINQLPGEAILRFFAQGASKSYEVKGSDILAIIGKNIAAGDKSDAARTYWAPMAEGANATIEIELPAGVKSSDVSVSIPSISHIFLTNKEISTMSELTYSGDANLGLYCEVDIKCTSPLPAATDAVAHLKFNIGAGTFICSGTLLNDSISSATPYLLTANHCIENQTVASTLEFWFKYRALVCNDGSTGEYFPTYGGADLLYTAYVTDSTFLRLRSAPAVAGVLFAGWDATTPPAVSTTVHTVHHPRGDQQRLSRGTVTGYSYRDAANPNFFWNSDVTNGQILKVTLTTGITEGGSSGSGLFKGADANPQLIGQLFGGNAAVCGSPKNNLYGRFDVAYNAGMSDWLTQGVKTVMQLYNASTDTLYYTIGVTDANNVISLNPAYSNQGSSFKASTIPAAGLSPVHRFFNTYNGTYFYTISEKERAAVATNTPRMRYDGIVWYANATPATGTVPLYSAFNKTTGSQYFTTSLTSRSNLITANPQFITDGIAFYVTP